MNLGRTYLAMILIILFALAVTAVLYYLLYYRVEVNVINVSVEDVDGYPSLVIDFEASRTDRLVFMLYDDSGMLRWMAPASGGRVALHMGGYHENIVGEKTYRIEARYGDRVVFSMSYTVRGIRFNASLVDLGFGQAGFMAILSHVVFEVTNTGDVPLYIDGSTTRVYIEGGQGAGMALNDLVLMPGETGKVTLGMAGMTRGFNVTLVLNISGVEERFNIDLTKYMGS